MFDGYKQRASVSTGSQELCYVLINTESQSGLPCPPPGDLPDPGIEPGSLRSHLLHWQAGFPTSATWEARSSTQSISNRTLVSSQEKAEWLCPVALAASQESGCLCGGQGSSGNRDFTRSQGSRSLEKPVSIFYFIVDKDTRKRAKF